MTLPLPPIAHGRNRELLKDPLTFFLTLTRQYGDVVCYRSAPERAYLVNHPDYVRHVLVDNNKNYSKATHTNQLFKTAVGDGLATSEGEAWRRQRRLIQPAFHPPRVAKMASIVTARAAQMIENWQAAAEHAQPIYLAEEVAQLILSITARALFGVDLGEEAAKVGRAVNMGGALLERPNSPLFKSGIQMGEEIVQGIVARRRQSLGDNGEAGDLLGTMLRAQVEDPSLAMDDVGLRNQVVTLLLAGYETTASALSWTLYLLSLHPEVVSRLRETLRQALDGRTPGYADVPALDYARMVFEESIRLYPPGWVEGRVALADDQIGGYFVPAGTFVAISPYTLQRHLSFWDDPENFDPERFTPERSAKRGAFAYIPFGAGPRQCVGKNLALLEAQLIIAMVIQRFDLSLIPDHEIKPEVGYVLRPDMLMKMKVTPLISGG